jgi:hypothetical protein
MTHESINGVGHQAYLGEEVLPWLTQDWVLSQFARTMDVARSRYKTFVQQGMDEGHREDFHRGSQDPRVLGDDSFVNRVLSDNGTIPVQPPSLDAIVASVCQAYGLDETALCARTQQRVASEARATVGWLAVEFGSATLTEVGRRLRRDVGSMSSGVRRLTARAHNSEKLARMLSHLKSTAQ